MLDQSADDGGLHDDNNWQSDVCQIVAVFKVIGMNAVAEFGLSNKFCFKNCLKVRLEMFFNSVHVSYLTNIRFAQALPRRATVQS